MLLFRGSSAATSSKGWEKRGQNRGVHNKSKEKQTKTKKKASDLKQTTLSLQARRDTKIDFKGNVNNVKISGKKISPK